jgi:hypothetical protein
MLYGGLSDASAIWTAFGDYICDDLPRDIHRRALRYSPDLPRPDLDFGLFLISRELTLDDRCLRDFNLPNFVNEWDRDRGNPLIRHELDYDYAALAAAAAARELVLNPDQLRAYNAILSQLDSDPTNAVFFLNGPGGTGKTFLYRCLCERLRSSRKIVLCRLYRNCFPPAAGRSDRPQAVPHPARHQRRFIVFHPAPHSAG